MSILRVLSRRGDDTYSWDPSKIGTADHEALAAIREAERVFEEARARGATAFKTEPGQPAKRIDKFDQTAQEIILVPRVVGG